MKLISFAISLSIAAAACAPHELKVAPVTVQPIHVVVDVNLHDDPAAPTTTQRAAKR